MPLRLIADGVDDADEGGYADCRCAERDRTVIAVVHMPYDMVSGRRRLLVVADGFDMAIVSGGSRHRHSVHHYAREGRDCDSFELFVHSLFPFRTFVLT